MSYRFDSRLGALLYEWLPEVYRARDRQPAETGDATEYSLARYLDAHGVLLDEVHATIEQLLRDGLPGSSQEWLVSYFAKLVATTVVSPDLAGKHAEISNAIGWRQRKGTLNCAEAIAEAVGRTEAELQEGWSRVVLTAHVGRPLLALGAIDSAVDLDLSVPWEAAQHPGLPAATVDFGQPSRAVSSSPANPASRTSTFDGVTKTWRQANRHGLPCFPGSFEDVSRRVVDLRTSGEPNGCYHPKRLMLFIPPADGFFAETKPLAWAARLDPVNSMLVEETIEGEELVIRNRTGHVVEIEDEVTLVARPTRIEGIRFLKTVTMVPGGRLTLSGVEAFRVDVATFDAKEPVLTANDSLFEELSSPGLVRLDSCTVLGTAAVSYLSATDSIFMGMSGNEIRGAIEYCRIPENAINLFDTANMSLKSHAPLLHGRWGYQPVTDHPAFMGGQTALCSRAVLSPHAPAAISVGASDRGEMGYFHHGRTDRPVHLNGLNLSAPKDGGYPLEDVIFDTDLTVTSGRLVLRRAAAPVLTIAPGAGGDEANAPALDARDCLFKRITADSHLIRLEYCTVMETTRCAHLQASDCIFVDTVIGPTKAKGVTDCLRYSSVPRTIRDDTDVTAAFQLIGSGGQWTLRTNTLDRPLFGMFYDCESKAHRAAAYGERGYGVLDAHSPRSVRLGAEDGGELGAYHYRQYALKAEAMLAKIREFLPVGIEPVLIEDERLLHVPPEQTNP